MGKHMSAELKEFIFKMFQMGDSIRKISKDHDIPFTKVIDFISKRRELGVNARKSGSGRPSGLNTEIKKALVRSLNETPTNPAVKHGALVKKSTGISIKKRTINNYINLLGFESGSPLKKPLLNKKHIEKRIEACQEWLYWPDEKWKTVIFSDETKINLRNSDGNKKVWRKNGERLLQKNRISTGKFSGRQCYVLGTL